MWIRHVLFTVAVLAAVYVAATLSFTSVHRGPASATTVRGVRQWTPGHPVSRSRAKSHPAHHGPTLSLKKAVGQLLIGTYAGEQPTASILHAVRSGQLGAVILMGGNTAGGVAATRSATEQLQAAAHAGGNPGLLIMTDQEGGEVKRLVGPPGYAAAGMSSAELAGKQGTATAGLLRQAGINVDLAPVADVSRIDGFITQQQRTFGSDGHSVARSACAFAQALARDGIAYTLKHFPGLGDATDNTDNTRVGIAEPASEIRADDEPYRRCAHGPLALVMVSSASYNQITGATPAVLSSYTYRTLMPSDRIAAVTVSDSFESGAISGRRTPARRAINAGLDMVMYPGQEAASREAYRLLLQDARAGTLSRSRVRRAAGEVLALKARLGLH